MAVSRRPARSPLRERLCDRGQMAKSPPAADGSGPALCGADGEPLMVGQRRVYRKGARDQATCVDRAVFGEVLIGETFHAKPHRQVGSSASPQPPLQTNPCGLVRTYRGNHDARYMANDRSCPGVVASWARRRPGLGSAGTASSQPWEGPSLLRTKRDMLA